MRELRFAEVDLVQVRGLGFACPPGTRGHVPPRDPPIVLCHQEQNLFESKGLRLQCRRVLPVYRWGARPGPEPAVPGRQRPCPATAPGQLLGSGKSGPRCPRPPSLPPGASLRGCRENLSEAIFTTSFLPVAFLLSFLALKAVSARSGCEPGRHPPGARRAVTATASRQRPHPGPRACAGAPDAPASARAPPTRGSACGSQPARLRTPFPCLAPTPATLSVVVPLATGHVALMLGRCYTAVGSVLENIRAAPAERPRVVPAASRCVPGWRRRASGRSGCVTAAWRPIVLQLEPWPADTRILAERPVMRAALGRRERCPQARHSRVEDRMS